MRHPSRERVNGPSRLYKAAGPFTLFVRKAPPALLLTVWSLLGLPAVPWAATDGEKPAGPVHLQTRVARKEITIGDHLRYTITISAETGVDVSVPLFHERIGDFDIIDFGREPDQPQAERTTSTQWYTLTIFTTGYHMLPAPRAAYTTPDGSQHEATGEALRVHVASLLAQEGQPTDIRDIKPPEAVPFNWWPALMGGAAMGALIGLGVALSYFLNRLRRAAVLPPRPAHEVALEALAHLRATRLPQAGQFEAYYVTLSAIVRTYLEDGLQVRAPEMTTEEFLVAVTRDTRPSRLPPAQQHLLSTFLARADLVKFARHRPSLDESEAAYEAAKRFVDETRPRPAQTRSDEHNRPQEGQHAAA